jgi:serine phosphatase RsbU (regulator of sigma subunit)
METSIPTSFEESLRYAEFLQKALFPKQRHFDRIFKDSFVLFKPMHFVSGDFFWLTERNGLIYIAVGDCAGHGVPGAILSVLMHSLLDYAILNKKLKKTHKIIREVNSRFIESFSSNDTHTPFDNEWVDITLCCIEPSSQTIFYTSCRREILHILGGKHILHKGNKHPIGDWQYNANSAFSSACFNYNEGDIIYLGTDGFQDQIGGERSKKYQKSRLHNLIIKISDLTLSRQKAELEKELDQWMDGHLQTDDICIVGIKL